MNYRLLPALCLAMAFSTTAGLAATEFNDPPSTYPGMELLEPDEENASLCQALPVSENFSNPDHFDGTSPLPKGWTSTGSAIWRTASASELTAASGDYYMIAPESNIERDERAYTPFFYLEKGVTYTITFMSHQEGTTVNGVTNLNTINLRAGTQHDAEFLPVTIGSVSRHNKANAWDEHSYTFSPAVSGPYCFCFELHGTPYSGFAAVDNVRITSPKHQEAVEPLFHPFGIFSINSNAVIAMGNAPVRMVHYVANGNPTAWQTEGAFTEMLQNGDANVYFDNSGDYNVTLTAANFSSEKQLTKSVRVEHFSEPGEGLCFASFDPVTAKLISRGDIPAFSSDPYALDFVTGPNHYYSTYAEFFPAPEEAEISVSGLGFRLTNLRYVPVGQSSDDDALKPFRVKFYGVDENGLPDESNLFASFNFTMRSFFGTSVGSLSGDERTVKLPRPVTVKGPFFVAFEFSEKILIDPVDPNVGRTFCSIGIARHIHGRTTLFCKPYKAPPFTKVELDEWCPVSDLHSSLLGTGLNLRLDASYVPGHVGVCLPGVTAATTCRLAGRALLVSTPAGADVEVFALDGVKVLATSVEAGEARVDISALSSGIYVVKAGDAVTRIAIK